MGEDDLVMTHEERVVFNEIARHFATTEAPDPDVSIERPPRGEKRRGLFRRDAPDER
jgi:hypothetical protein